MRVLELLLFVSCCQANIALRKPTKMTYRDDEELKSYLAVDGNWDDGHPNCPFITAVNNNDTVYLAIDLQNSYNVTQIHIEGPIESYDHPRDFYVEVIADTCVCNSWDSLSQGEVTLCHYQQDKVQSITVSCPNNTIGRFIRLRHKLMNKTLEICEVEVEGDLTFKLDALQDNDYRACGMVDTGFSGVAMETKNVRSDIQCTSMCKQRSGCCAAEYDKQRKECTLRGPIQNGSAPYYQLDESRDVFFLS